MRVPDGWLVDGWFVTGWRTAGPYRHPSRRQIVIMNAIVTYK
jgi:hypothetical protein